MQHPNQTKTLDLRGATCPMAFVKTKLHLDKLSPGDRTKILYEQSPANEPLVRSIRSLGHLVLSQKAAEQPFQKDDEKSAKTPSRSVDVPLTILEIEVKE